MLCCAMLLEVAILSRSLQTTVNCEKDLRSSPSTGCFQVCFAVCVQQPSCWHFARLFDAQLTVSSQPRQRKLSESCVVQVSGNDSEWQPCRTCLVVTMRKLRTVLNLPGYSAMCRTARSGESFLRPTSLLLRYLPSCRSSCAWVPEGGYSGFQRT